MSFAPSLYAEEDIDAARELFATGKYAECAKATAKALEDSEFDED